MRHLASAVALLLAVGACTAPRDRPLATPTGQKRTPVQVETFGGTYTVDLVRDDQISTGWIDVPVDDAWRHLLAVYGALGFEVADLAEYIPEARRVTVSERRMRRIADKRLSTYIDCGYAIAGNKADGGNVKVYLSTWLEPKDDGTQVTTRFESSARDTGTSTAAVPCTTNGKLEQLIADQLVLRVFRERQGV